MIKKVHLQIVPDGAPDNLRIDGKSPLALAHTPALDKITKMSRTGLLKTLHRDLPKDSVVAQLGLLGYDPHKYFPGGRSYFELPDGVKANSDDLIFRANLVYFKNGKLKSYNGSGIDSEKARTVIKELNQKLLQRFPEFELYHNSDFRNTLIMRGVGNVESTFICPEPHEEEGNSFNINNLISSKSNSHNKIINRLNEFVSFIYNNTGCSSANAIFPWGISKPIKLPRFSDKISGCIIGSMDFLSGFSRSMKLDHYKVGNSSWNTDYKKKGELVIGQIKKGYDFIYCHINGPDEASHMNDIEKKIYSIEQIDLHILSPILDYFMRNPEKLGSVLVCPDHYTNITKNGSIIRKEAHSLDLVPFLLWNNNGADNVTTYNEDSCKVGYFTKYNYTNLDILDLMGIIK